jgi:transposase-like protein
VHRPAVVPAIYALFLFGPGSDTLRGLVEDLAPFLDDESGTLLSWIVLGDPRRSGKAFRAYLEARHVAHAVLTEQWKSALEEQGDSRNVIAVETAQLAGAFGVTPDEMPLIILVVDGAHDDPLHVRLPSGAASSLERCRAALSSFRKHLSEKVLRNLIGTTSGHVPARVLDVLRKQVADCLLELGRQEDKDGVKLKTPEVKKRVVIDLVADGMSISEAARSVDISRQALDQDPVTKQAIKDAKTARASRATKAAPGTKVDGRVEGEERHGADAE